MLKAELQDIIDAGEGAKVEFKRDGVRPERLARESVSFANILRDYGLMDDRGMGIRRKVIPLMRERNGTEPHFEATDDYFRVTLWKRRKTRNVSCGEGGQTAVT